MYLFPLLLQRAVSRHLAVVSAMFMLALALGAPSSALAVPAMELRAEDILNRIGDLKKSLNLAPNQQTLWQQVEMKSRALLNTRQGRRERLQADLNQGLSTAGVELRDLNRKIETEAETSHAEDKQLRELWLTMNDALTDDQRQTVQSFLMDQLQRAGGPREGMPEHGSSGRRGPGMGGPKGGMGRGGGLQF